MSPSRALRYWCVFAAATAGGITVFICGVVLGIWLGVVALRIGSSTIVYPHEVLWMRCLAVLTVAASAVLGWLTHRVLAHRDGRRT